MTENEYRKRVIRAMIRTGFSVQPLEDMHSKFVPDLIFAKEGKMGAMELKYLPDDPKSLDAIKHYTKGQEQWLTDWGKKNGENCFLLIGIERSSLHYIFRSSVLKKARKLPFDEAAAAYACVISDHTLAGWLSVIV